MLRRLPTSTAFPYTTLFRSSNSGTLAAGNGGALNLGGAFTTAGIGTLTNSGGTVNITGTLDNTSQEHTSKPTSLRQNVCRLLLENKTASAHAGALLWFRSDS